MRSGSVSVHLVLDSKSVYNTNYDELKLQLALAHGPKLVDEFDRKLACQQAKKPYRCAPFVSDVLAQMQKGMSGLTAEEAVVQRLQERKQVLSAIPCKDSSSAMSALTVLKGYARDIDNGYANFVTRLPAPLQHQLFTQANQPFIQNIQNDVERGALVYVASGGTRQFISHNAFEYLVHDTGCQFQDLHELVSQLRVTLQKPESVHLDALTLYDVIHELPAGDHYKHVIGLISQAACFSDCEHLDFVSTYLHAQYHAHHHGDRPIELHCYVSTEAAAAKLRTHIVNYHDRLPQNVNILVTKYNGKTLEVNACTGSAERHELDFAGQARAMLQALPKVGVSESSNTEDNYFVAMLDADNCIYNVYYFMLLTRLVEKFGDRLVAAKNSDKKSAAIIALAQEMLEFVQMYPESGFMARKINYRYLNTIRDVLVEKFSSLPLDNDIIAMRENMLAADSKVFDKNKHGPIFCQFIRMLASYSPNIMTTIILRANQRLFEDMKLDAKVKRANKIALLIASMREYYYADLKNAVWNGTGRFHLDLGRMVTMLNSQAKDGDPQFVFDDVTLVDYHLNLAPGSHVRLSGLPAHKAMTIPCANEKIDTLYLNLHHAKRKYRVDEVDFFDDTLRVFEGLQRAYGKNDTHGLLPEGMIARLVGYDGKYMRYETCITGRGPVDMHPYHLFNYLSQAQDRFIALIEGRLDKLPYVREQAMSEKIHTFLTLTRWSQPDEFFAPARSKTMRKIFTLIQVLEEAVEHFSNTSNHVKHGMYAGQKPLPVRQITAVLQAIKSAAIAPVPGLEKIMEYAAHQSSIYRAAKKLRDFIKGSNEEQFTHMQITGLGSKSYV